MQSTSASSTETLRIVGTRTLGAAVLEAAVKFALAREAGTPLTVIHDRSPIAQAVAALRPEGVEVASAGTVRTILMQAMSSHRAHRRDLRANVERRLALSVKTTTNRRVRHELSALRHRLADSQKQVRLPRQLLREPLQCRLSASSQMAVDAALQAHGVAPDARIACLYVSEDADERRYLLADAVPFGFDAPRVSDASDFQDAVRLLREYGYTVVRLGHGGARVTDGTAPINLARSASRSPLLELGCMLRAELVLCTDSSPLGLTFLGGPTLVCVNVTSPIAAYPVHRRGFMLPRRVITRDTLEDVAITDWASDPGGSGHYFVDNSPEQISAAVLEALEWAGGAGTETPWQAGLRERLQLLALAEPERLPYGWQADAGFLGDGRVSRAAVR